MFFHSGESLKHGSMEKTPNNGSRIYATLNEAGTFYYMLAIVVSMFWLTCSTGLVC